MSTSELQPNITIKTTPLDNRSKYNSDQQIISKIIPIQDDKDDIHIFENINIMKQNIKNTIQTLSAEKRSHSHSHSHSHSSTNSLHSINSNHSNNSSSFLNNISVVSQRSSTSSSNSSYSISMNNDNDISIHAKRRYKLNDNCIGICQFIGSTSFANGIWVGLVMENGNGNTNGTIYGRKYFSCRDGKGLFIRPARIIAEIPRPPSRRKKAHATPPPTSTVIKHKQSISGDACLLQLSGTSPIHIDIDNDNDDFKMFSLSGSGTHFKSKSVAKSRLKLNKHSKSVQQPTRKYSKKNKKNNKKPVGSRKYKSKYKSKYKMLKEKELEEKKRLKSKNNKKYKLKSKQKIKKNKTKSPKNKNKKKNNNSKRAISSIIKRRNKKNIINHNYTNKHTHIHDDNDIMLDNIDVNIKYHNIKYQHSQSPFDNPITPPFNLGLPPQSAENSPYSGANTPKYTINDDIDIKYPNIPIETDTNSILSLNDIKTNINVTGDDTPGDIMKTLQNIFGDNTPVNNNANDITPVRNAGGGAGSGGGFGFNMDELWETGSIQSDSVLDDDEWRKKQHHRARQESLAQTYADAQIISALNPIKKKMNSYMAISNEKWKPPSYDLKPDHSDMLQPKLLHHKKHLDEYMNSDYIVPKKLGPTDMGRMKGFRSPAFSKQILRQNNNDNSIFTDKDKGWYPVKSSIKKSKTTGTATATKDNNNNDDDDDKPPILKHSKSRSVQIKSKSPRILNKKNKNKNNKSKKFGFNEDNEINIFDDNDLNKIYKKKKNKSKKNKKSLDHKRSLSTMSEKSGSRSKKKVNSPKRRIKDNNNDEWIEKNGTWIPKPKNYKKNKIKKLGPRDIGKINYKGTKLKNSNKNGKIKKGNIKQKNLKKQRSWVPRKFQKTLISKNKNKNKKSKYNKSLPAKIHQQYLPIKRKPKSNSNASIPINTRNSPINTCSVSVPIHYQIPSPSSSISSQEGRDDFKYYIDNLLNSKNNNNDNKTISFTHKMPIISDNMNGNDGGDDDDGSEDEEDNAGLVYITQSTTAPPPTKLNNNYNILPPSIDIPDDNNDNINNKKDTPRDHQQQSSAVNSVQSVQSVQSVGSLFTNEDVIFEDSDMDDIDPVNNMSYTNQNSYSPPKRSPNLSNKAFSQPYRIDDISNNIGVICVIDINNKRNNRSKSEINRQTTPKKSKKQERKIKSHKIQIIQKKNNKINIIGLSPNITPNISPNLNPNPNPNPNNDNNNNNNKISKNKSKYRSKSDKSKNKKKKKIKKNKIWKGNLRNPTL